MHRTLFALLLLTATSVVVAADRPDAKAVDGLRGTYPTGSIDSVARADAALTATAGAKTQVEKDGKAAARDCLKTILVNDCLDRARDLQRRRLADIDAVELEANRYKRRAHADQVEADRRLREAEREKKAPADAQQRVHNQESFDARQTQAARDAADRVRSQASHSAAKPHRPVIKVPQTPADVAAAQRAKNVVDYDAKVKQATEHGAEITRRVASKEVDRKKKAEAKAAKDAKDAAAANPAAAVPQPALPAPSGTKP